MFSIVAKQMLVMGIFMFIGAALYKSKLIGKEGSKTLSTLLIYLVTPIAILRSLCVERTPERVKAYILSFFLGLFVQLLGLIAAHIIYRKHPMEEFAITYPNAGFFGIPVIQAVLGPEAVFYIAPLAVFVGALQHSYGVYLLLGSNTKMEWKRAFLAPCFITFIAGSVLFFTGLGTKLPDILKQCVDSIGNMNAFCAMALLGMFLVQSDLKQLYKNIDIYIVSFLRILVLPLFCAVIFRFIPVPFMMKMAILLAFAGPVGSNVANYSLLYNKDYSTASLYVTVSTVLCLGTLPLFSAITEKII